MRSVVAFGMALVSICAACQKKQELAAASGVQKSNPPTGAKSIEAPKPSGPFSATLAGTHFVFKSAWVKPERINTYEMATLVLSAGTQSCGGGDDALRIELTLHAGPGGRLFAGDPYPLDMIQLEPPKKFVDIYRIMSPYLELQLDKGATITKGEHVKGRLEFDFRQGGKAYQGSGTFDALVCETGTLVALAEPKDTGPLVGSAGGGTFVAKNAIATLRHDEQNNIDYIDDLSFYSSEVTCADADTAKTTRRPRLLLPHRLGVTSRRQYLGTTIPMVFSYAAAADDYVQLDEGWIRIDAVELRAGGTLKGALSVEPKSFSSAGKAKFAGSFSATICQD